MDNLIKKIISSTENKSVLQAIDLKSSKWIKTGKEAISLFDEGSQIFFDEYGKLLPFETKVSISIHNLLINPKTGEVFAFQHGRFTFLLKYHKQKAPILESNLKAITADGHIDFEFLGNEWTILDASFEDEESEQFLYAYEQTFEES